MLGFARMLRHGLEQDGHKVVECYPKAVFGRFWRPFPKTRKWFAYVDKYLIFPSLLSRRRKTGRPDLAHVCDHSNAVYLPSLGDSIKLVTCHDVIAIRAALDHFPQTRVGAMGKKLQARIFRSLKQADHVTCDSENSRQDLGDLAPCLTKKSNVVHLGFNQPMQRMEGDEAKKVLRSLPFSASKPFLLHVGNDAWYKNRYDLLRIYSTYRKRFSEGMKLVLVGPPLNERQRSLALKEGFIDEITWIDQASTELLRALYSTARALIFPSLYEGFGWPPLEAQSCGCPVVASPLGSLSEILENGGILIDPSDKERYASAINRLEKDIGFRDQEIEKGFSNAKRFDAKKTVAEYLSVYDHVIKRKDNAR